MAWLLIFPIVWIAIVAGRQINRMICPALNDADSSPVERTCFGLGTGYFVLAYGVLALGLLGQLSPIPVAIWCAVLAIFGAKENAMLAMELLTGISGLRASTRWPVYLAVALLIMIGSASVAGCFTPPTSFEWDSLSYHLADPKIFARAHRIFYLPWESHSNFAFDMEMLYSIGMMARSIALAKLLHFAIAVAGVFGLFRLALRLAGRSVAWITVICFVTIPLVFWEAGTAYVDLAATTYSTLSLLSLTRFAQTKDLRFVLLSGLMLGGMLGIKATALVTITLYAAGLVVVAMPDRERVAKAIKYALFMGLIALAIGSPWYIKSWIYTGNPFYPFAYGLFGGRYWSAANSLDYTAAQYSFGVGHRPADLLLAPWNLTMYLMPGHVPAGNFPRPFNDIQTPFASLSPVFLVILVAGPLVAVSAPRWVRILTAYSVVSIIIWFFLTQQVRYFLPVTPVLCVLSGWTTVRLWREGRVLRFAAALPVAASIICAVFLAGILSTQDWQIASSADAREAYLSTGLESYSAMSYINSSTPPNAKVVCYGEPRGFYLDRDYIWGDPGHSLLIPYDKMRTPADLSAYLTERGYHYILINQRYAQILPTSTGWPVLVYGLTFGGKPPIYADYHAGVFVFSL